MSRVAFGHVDDFLRRTFGHDVPAARAAFGTEVNDPVCRFDHVQNQRDYFGTMTVKFGTIEKCFALKVATALPRNSADAATIRS